MQRFINNKTSNTQHSTTAKGMSTYTGRRISPQRERDTKGQRQDNVYSKAQHGVVLGRKADRDDCPFPNKPVSHKSSFSSKTQNSPDLFEVVRNPGPKQKRGPVLSQEHHVDGSRETTESQYRIKDLHRLPSEELQMAKAICEKQLKLQEKLWRVEEKIRHKIQSNIAEAAAGNDEMKRRGWGQPEQGQTQTKTRLAELHDREMLIQERKQVDVKQLRGKQDQQNEEKMKNKYGEDGAGGRRGETKITECPQSKGKLTKRIPQQKVSGAQNKLRWENVKEHSRRKWEEKDDIYGGERSQHGTEKTKAQNQQNKGDVGWTREENYWERTCDEQDMPQISEQKSACTLETENHRDAEHKTLRESSLPPDCSPSHSCRRREDEEELLLRDSTGTNFQLLPCRICSRMFASERLEKHVQICKKVKQSHRQVFNSYANRTKGSALEEFLKTHTRNKTPEVLQKKNSRQNDKANTKTVHRGRLPAGTSQSKWSK